WAMRCATTTVPGPNTAMRWACPSAIPPAPCGVVLERRGHPGRAEPRLAVLAAAGPVAGRRADHRGRRRCVAAGRPARRRPRAGLLAAQWAGFRHRPAALALLL